MQLISPPCSSFIAQIVTVIVALADPGGVAVAPVLNIEMSVPDGGDNGAQTTNICPEQLEPSRC